MNNRLTTFSTLTAAVLLTACASAPMTTPTLEQARADYSAAVANAQVTQYAGRELRQAGESLDQANAAAAERASLSEVDRLAYLAKQRVASAQELATARAAEAELATAANQRDQLRLEARTAEAERARREAEQAQAQAQAAQQQNAALAARAAELEGQLAELKAVKTERGYVMTIGDVLFGHDQSSLSPNAHSTLRKLADVMQQNPNRTVLVEGFTDSTGSDSYNMDLSQRRANAVATALAQMGVARERIRMRAYGKAFPVAANDTAANRQLNRRVEIVLSNDGTAIPERTALR